MLTGDEARLVMLRDYLVTSCAILLVLWLVWRRWGEISDLILGAPVFARRLALRAMVVTLGWVAFALCTNVAAYREGFTLTISGAKLSYAPLTVLYFPEGSAVPINKIYALSDTNLTSGSTQPLALSYTDSAINDSELSIRSIETDGANKSYEVLLRENPVLEGRDRILLKARETLTLAGISRQARISLAPKLFGGELEVLLAQEPIGVIPIQSERVAGRFLSFDVELGRMSWESRADGERIVQVSFPTTGMAVGKIALKAAGLRSLTEIEQVRFDSLRSTPGVLSVVDGWLHVRPEDANFNAGLSNFQILAFALAPVVAGACVLLISWAIWFVGIRERSSLLQFAFVWGICAGAGLLVLSGVWPGAYTADSFIYPGIEQGLVSNYKPYIYTLYLGILRCFSAAPAFPLVVQVCGVALLLAVLAVRSMQCARLGGVGVLVSLSVLYLSPVFPLYLTTLWKDVPFSVGLVVLFLIIFFGRLSQRCFSTAFLLLVFAPLLVIFSGMRHTGFVSIAVLSVLMLSARLCTRRQVAFLLGACALLAVFFSSAFNVITNSKSRTEYDRMRLFPYIIYASYLPLRAHLDSLDLEDADASRIALERIASVDDFNGIDLMFAPDKVNFNVSDAEFAEFRAAILRGIVSNPQYFFRHLIVANWELISAKRYVWDRGFLPLHRRLAFSGNYYFSEDYLGGRVSQASSSAMLAKKLEDRLSAGHNSWHTRILNSYIPHLALLILSALGWRWVPAAALFALCSLAAYLGVFLMPASMEFRYGFHLMVSGILLPLLIAIDLARKWSGPTRT